MTIKEQQIKVLLDMLVRTNDSEIDCGSCLDLMSEFAEKSLAGKSIPEGMRSIDDHLQLCGECREEFEALKAALAADHFD